MNSFVKMLLCLSIVAIVLFSPFSIRAAARDSSVVTSYIVVGAGSSAYSSETSTKTSYSNSYYIRLRWFKFQYYPDNCLPGGCYIYASLCDENTKNPIGGYISFSGPTSVGSYNISYPVGYGNVGDCYVLRTNSSYSLTGYECIFDWNADAYV